MTKYYMAPPKALRKLRLAEGLRTAVWIFGVSGTGKTTLIREYLKDRPFLYLSSSDPEWDLDSLTPLPEDAEQFHIVVADDLQFLKDGIRMNELSDLYDRRDCWLIMISRSDVPHRFAARRAAGELIVIKEEDLVFSADEIGKIASAYSFSFSEEQSERIHAISRGNIFMISDILAHYDGGSLDNEFISFTQRANRYIDEQIIRNWSSGLQDFVMRVSVVKEFTLPLAEAITGDDRASAWLDEARQVGSFLEQEGEVYRMRIRDAAREKAEKVLGTKTVRRCLYNAGHWYELNDNIPEALSCYKECGEQECIEALLIRNARHNPGNGYFYELRNYYFALPEESVVKNTALMSALSMLCSMQMDQEGSEYWYGKLMEFAKMARSADKKEAYSLLLYLDIALPHRPVFGLPDVIKSIPDLIRGRGISISPLSITNNQPSQMDGGKDFCDWSRHDIQLAKTLGPFMTRAFGSQAKGLTENALAESFYEKGEDDLKVLNHLTRALAETGAGGFIEQAFVSVGIQIRLSVLMGDEQNARHLLDGFEERAKREGAARLLPNLDALRARLDLRCGNRTSVRKWMERSSDPSSEFCTLKRYEYMTRARVCIAEHRYLEAETLLLQMQTYAEFANRTRLKMEIGLLEAVILRNTGKPWKEDFLQVLKVVKEYGFIRPVSEYGAAALPLLKEIKNDYRSLPDADEKWFGRVFTETKHVADLYPAYLGADTLSAAGFPEDSLKILQLQAEGKTLKEIAETLGMALRTAKYHAAANYARLGVSGKTQAVQKAKQLGLI